MASTHNNVVDRDMDELNEEADEAHDSEADAGGHGDLLELCNVWKENGESSVLSVGWRGVWR